MQIHIGIMFPPVPLQEQYINALEITKKVITLHKEVSVSWFGSDLTAGPESDGFGIFSFTEVPFFSGIMMCLDTQCLPVALRNQTQQVYILKTDLKLNAIELLSKKNENVKYLHYYAKDINYFKVKTGKESEEIFEYFNRKFSEVAQNDSN